MQEPETLADLATELRSLPGRKRQTILNALSSAERTRMMALLNEAPETRIVVAAPAENEFEGLSGWLSARLQQAQSGTLGTCNSWKITGATWQLLARAAEEQISAAPMPQPLPPPVVSERSLLAAIGEMFSRKRAPS